MFMFERATGSRASILTLMCFCYIHQLPTIICRAWNVAILFLFSSMAMYFVVCVNNMCCKYLTEHLAYILKPLTSSLSLIYHRQGAMHQNWWVSSVVYFDVQSSRTTVNHCSRLVCYFVYSTCFSCLGKKLWVPANSVSQEEESVVRSYFTQGRKRACTAANKLLL